MVVAVLAIAQAATGHAADSQPGPSGATIEEINRFAAGLKQAVVSSRPEEVAKYVAFPLRINDRPGRFRHVKKRQFIAEYRRIFNSSVLSAISNQDPSRIFQNSTGIMFGDGELWAAGLCKDKACRIVELKVIAINHQ